jgi:TRAP-type C4-dicarboxylate transport system substrate-binding protein
MLVRGMTAVAGAVALLLGAGGSAPAEEAKLMFAVSAPAMSHINVRVFAPWSERVNAAGKGVVQIDPRFGTGITTAVNFYDRMLADVVQMVWGTTGSVAGKFNLSQVVTLPFLVGTGEIGSIAYWRLFKSGLLDAEFADTHVIMLNAYPQYGAHFAKIPSKPVTDLKGMRMIVTQKSFGDVTEALGGAPLAVPISDIYTSLQRGVAEGTITQWTVFQPFKLIDVLNYHMDGNLGSAAGAFIMNKKRWDALSADAKKILDAHSGEIESRDLGKFWDTVADEMREQVRGTPGHKIDRLAPDVEAKWNAATKPLVEQWVKETPGGDKVLAAFRGYVAEAEKGTVKTAR